MVIGKRVPELRVVMVNRGSLSYKTCSVLFIYNLNINIDRKDLIYIVTPKQFNMLIIFQGVICWLLSLTLLNFLIRF